MIIYTKKNSATEAPKFISKIGNAVKSGLKSTWDTLKETKNVLTNQPSEQTKQSLIPQERMTKFDQTKAQELNKRLVGLNDSEKKQLINSQLPESIHTEARQELLQTLLKESQPFTSELFKLLTNHLNKTMNLENAQIIEKNAQMFNKIFDTHGTNGIRLDSSAFQLKAIKYFTQKNSDLKTLKKGRNWRSTSDMKYAINNMSDSDKNKLKNAPSKDNSEITQSEVDKMRSEIEKKLGERAKNLKWGKPGEAKMYEELEPAELKMLYDNLKQAGVLQ